jgi:hypothetical protein
MAARFIRANVPLDALNIRKTGLGLAIGGFPEPDGHVLLAP